MSWLKAPDTAATIPAEPLRAPVDTFMRVHISVGASKAEPFAECLFSPSVGKEIGWVQSFGKFDVFLLNVFEII